jgi:hypothetical protein
MDFLEFEKEDGTSNKIWSPFRNGATIPRYKNLRTLNGNNKNWIK